VRGPSGFIIECVKDRKRRLVEAYREPSDRTGLGQDERPCIRKKCRDFILFTGLCLQLNIQCETRHRLTPFLFCGLAPTCTLATGYRSALREPNDRGLLPPMQA